MDAPIVPGYRITHRLGAGASGSVWAATRERDGARLAVKVVPVGGDPDDAQRVAHELGVMQRVRAEGLVGFHEAVGLPTDPPAVALVLDRVDGGSLVSVLAARGRLSAGEAATVVSPVARALSELHAAGVVHGDVTPGNVLLERSGRPLLADLGVVSFVGQAPGELWGTDGFVAPEVILGAVPTPAADVYAVGALGWCCVTGSPPDPPALRRPLTELAPDLPPAWVEAVVRCLSADPAQRPSAAEAALLFFDAAPCEALRLVVAGDETSLLTHRLRSGTPPPAPHPGNRGGPRRTVTAVAGATAVMGMAATVAALAGSSGLERVADAAAGAAWPGTPSHASSTGIGTPVRDPLRDRSAPTTALPRLMQALAERRAAAMNSGVPADLSEADVPGSPALASDSAHLRQMAVDELRYEGVALTVRGTRLVRQHGTLATVRASVDTAAYRVVAASGPTQRYAAQQGPELSFELVWSDARWRVFRVRAPGPPG